MSDHDDIRWDFLKRDRGALELELRNAGAVFKGKETRCPFCDDAHPSAGIYEAEGGVWRFKCHKCGMNEDIIGVRATVAGKGSADVMRDAKLERRPPAPKPKYFETIEALKGSVRGLEQCYVYTHPDTKSAQMVVLRYRDNEGRKKFIQACASGVGFVMQAPRKPWPIYNRIRIRDADTVIVVEGEKCVHALAKVGIVATTSPGGAGKASMADWSPLSGKRVYLWPDNDPADEKGVSKGAEHMRDVYAQLEKLADPPVVFWIDPGPLGLPPKGDVVEYIDTYGGDTIESKRNALECATDMALPMGGASPLAQRIEDAKAGKLNPTPFPFRLLTKLSRALIPGTVTCICADPGSGKSFFALECFGFWHRNNIKAAAFMLEDGKDYHLNRILAQLDGNGDLVRSEWIHANPKLADEAFAAHQKDIDAMARWLDATDEPSSYDVLLDWQRSRCAAGCKVLVIDPVTAVPTKDKPWVEDMRFLMESKRIVRQYGASLVLMTHPRTGKGGSAGSLGDLAGGAAFPRFSHSVFWIDKHDEPKDVMVRAGIGDISVSINRTIRMIKTRNGSGGGVAIGCIFNHELRFAEQGVVLKQEKKGRGSSGNAGVAAAFDPFSSTEAA